MFKYKVGYVYGDMGGQWHIQEQIMSGPDLDLDVYIELHEAFYDRFKAPDNVDIAFWAISYVELLGEEFDEHIIIAVLKAAIQSHFDSPEYETELAVVMNWLEDKEREADDN